MSTYTYESIPADGAAPTRFEVVQSMNDRPLETHPDTGEPVRRIITGGLGIKGKPIRRSTEVNKSLAAATPCGCSRTALAEIAGARGGADRHCHGHGHAGHAYGRRGHNH
jgi:predicted nucleic acid-binding Zn ribbon protein